MPDLINIGNLPDVFARQAASVQSAQRDVIVKAEDTIANVEKSDQALMQVLSATAQGTEQSMQNLENISGNLEKIAGNPFNELFGLFSPEWNQKVQIARANREQLRLTRQGQRTQQAKASHDLQIQSAGRELTLAEKRASIEQQGLQSLSTQASIMFQTRALADQQRERVLQGLTIDQIKTAMANPGKLGAGITQGDLNTALQIKERSAMQSELLRFQVQAAGASASEATRESINSKIKDVLTLAASDTQMQQMLETAKKAGGVFEVPTDMQIQPGVVLPKGTKIAASMIQSAITQKQTTAVAASKAKVELWSAQINNEGIIAAAESTLLRAQTNRTGIPSAGLDLNSFAPDEQAKIKQAQNLITLASEPTVDPMDALQLQTQAAETLTTIQKQVREAQLAAVDNAQAPAMQEFLDTGTVTNTASSAAVLESTLLNPNAVSSNEILSSVLTGLNQEAINVKSSESLGFTLPGTDIPIGRTKGLEGAAFVGQVFDNFAKKIGGDPAQIISGKAMLNYTSQILAALAEANPTAFGGLVDGAGNYTTAVTGDDGAVAEQDIVRALNKRTQELKESGAWKEGDPTMYDLVRTELRNPSLMQNFIQQNLTPATVEEAALFQRATGNRQVAHFQAKIFNMDGFNAQLSAMLAQDKTLLETDKTRQQRNAQQREAIRPNFMGGP